LVYDVGLHRGEDTALYLAQGYRVVAFEANAAHCAHCRERFVGDISAGRLTIVEGAVTDRVVETVEFYAHPANSEWGTTDRDWADRNGVWDGGKSVSVPAVNFAAWLTQTGVPFFMKVDIEGTGSVCLDSLRDVRDRPAYVSFETDKTCWLGLVHEIDLLTELGYDRFAVLQQAHIGGTLRTVMERHASGPFGPDLDRWESRTAALLRYRRIFILYRFFGHSSTIRNRLRQRRQSHAARAEVVSTDLSPRPSWSLHDLLDRLSYSLPGWHDVHARHNSTSPGVTEMHASRRPWRNPGWLRWARVQRGRRRSASVADRGLGGFPAVRLKSPLVDP
jgi:FkbM family methyltransferase